MSPRWGFKIFFYPMFYKHAAPLGLNAAMHQNSRWDIHRRGGVPPPNGLGDPTPTDSTSLCHLPIFPYPGGTCRPSGALGYLVYAVFYKHAAPLGLNDPLPPCPTGWVTQPLRIQPRFASFSPSASSVPLRCFYHVSLRCFYHVSIKTAHTSTTGTQSVHYIM